MQKSERFEISQSALIIDNNKLLILQLSNKKWVFVWWKINENENYVDSLQREVIEEIGFRKIKNLSIIAVDNWIYNWIPKYGVFFKCITDDVENIILSNEHKDFKWITKDVINTIDFFNEKMKNIAIKSLNY